ncbi:LysR family transcriptional regulator [Tateyamaria sp. SN6-1]|uniref:LysR family transcriptional regulator n=1 Tax=Tateyamaria sp. SN6-1 TaxID=3092148 RepID=UPI0039F55307
MRFAEKRFDWESLRVFLAVARASSLRGGARSLGVGHSTVSRRLAELEADLGTKLFEKISHGLALTEVGERVLQHVEEVETEMFSLERSVMGRDSEPAGQVRLTLPPALAYSPLMTDLAAFAKLYPKIEVEIVTSYGMSDMSRRDADVAIRFTENPDDWLFGRRLPEFHDAVYATPDYIASHSFEGTTPTARWLGWTGDDTHPTWVKSMPHPNCPVHWRMGDITAQATAAREGLGMALLPCLVGDLDPVLERVPPGEIAYKRTAWVLTHPDLKSSERVRVFTRYLVERIAARRSVIQGETR